MFDIQVFAWSHVRDDVEVKGHGLADVTHRP
jgi:hypothetical protein